MNTILVTGACGFLGGYVIRYYAQVGWCVIGVDSASEENAPHEYLTRYRSMQLPDLAFRQLLEEHQPSLIVHAAGRASVPMSMKYPGRDFEGNTVLVFELLEAMRRYSASSRFVLLSSAAVCGFP